MVAWNRNAIKAVITQDLNQTGRAWGEIHVLDHECQKCKQLPRAVRQGFITHKSLASQVSLEPIPLLEEAI